MEEKRIVCVGLDMYREWEKIELYVFFGYVHRMEEKRIVCVGLDMYREWEKIELYVLVWTCTENGSE